MCSEVCDEKCTVGLSEAWKNTTSKDIDKNPLMMLIYEDGGDGLTEYSIILTNNFKQQNHMRLNMFFTSLINLFKGLQALRLAGIMHGDMKPDNILYDEATNIVRFIDFGNATTEDKLLKAATDCLHDRFTSKTKPALDKEIHPLGTYYNGFEEKKINRVPDIKMLFSAIIQGKEETLKNGLGGLVNSVIANSDLYMLCQELIIYFKYYNVLLIRLTREVSPPHPNFQYMSFLTKFIDLLTTTLNKYTETDILTQLIAEYSRLLATELPQISGGYNKSNKRNTKRNTKRNAKRNAKRNTIRNAKRNIKRNTKRNTKIYTK
jgi:serine/threonine protein kinase